MIKTILLADDSITMQKVIRLTFASGGYEITTADNGDEAIKKAKDTRPHLVLVDAALPGRNGYEVCEAIKKDPELKNTPVMILAGTFNPLDEDLASKVGADDSIVKPFESKILIQKVESLFRKFPPMEREARAEAPPPAEGQGLGEWTEEDVITAPDAAEPLAPPMPEEGGGPAVEGAMPGFQEIAPEQAGPEEAASAEGPQATEEPGAESLPRMETPHGESEGEDGFDIEGFEINPFKSGPLREESGAEGGAEDELGGQWTIDENDVIGFDDLSSEEETVSEGAVQEEAAPEEEPALGGPGPVAGVEDEEGQAREETPGEMPLRDEAEEAGGTSAREEKACEPPDGLATEEAEESEAGVEDQEETVAAPEETLGAEGEESIPGGEEAEGEEIIPGPEEKAPTGEEPSFPAEEEETEKQPLEEDLAEETPAAPGQDASAMKEEGARAGAAGKDVSEEAAIRDVIRRATVDIIEEVVRDTVPQLLRKAMEEELDRIKEAIKKA